ncbi:DMT family transporter [Moraxella ovis]|nr:DMT family transporter [Moraxella ovis]
MNLKITPMRAEYLSLIAAMLNGTIGVFTRFGLQAGLAPSVLAFYKCFIAFIIIAIYCLSKPKLRIECRTLSRYWHHYALLSFFGIFCLYFFETWAFSEASIPLVVFLTYAAGAATILMAALFLGERPTKFKVAAFITIMMGVYLIFLFEHGILGSMLGIILALLGGFGYALFIFLGKLLNVGNGLAVLCWLFGFGSLYLLVSFLLDGFMMPSLTAMGAIMALVLLPAIAGFS